MQKGSTYPVKGGRAIRWREAGKFQSEGPFRNDTAARAWFAEHVAPRLRRRGPSPEITFEEFVEDVYLDRWGPVSDRTRDTLKQWIAPARTHFGDWKLAELEGAADDIARWLARRPSDDARYKQARALRQVLAGAKRWRYIGSNPAVDAGMNPQPRAEEIRPFDDDELAAIVDELAPRDAAITVFAAETGLRTNEWTATDRRDVDRRNPAVAVARRYSEGVLTPYPKTERRRVPLTPRAVEALEWLPPRVDTPVLFPGDRGGNLNLNNWRNRIWYPALEAAGVEKRGPYHLRHTFATEALAGGVSIFQLTRVMGVSSEVIELHYGHLTRESEDHIRDLLTRRPRASSDDVEAK